MPDYFTLAELRSMPGMDDTNKYTDARCEAAAAYIVAIIEREVGTSFVPRTVVNEIRDGDGCSRVLLKTPFVISVTSATVDGVAVTGTLSAADGVLTVLDTGSYSPSTWSTGTRNISVTYMAGYSSTPPADIKEAALKGTRAYLLSTNSNASFSDRQTSLSTDQGTISYVVAGADRPTGYPEVDAVIVGWKNNLNAFGFA